VVHANGLMERRRWRCDAGDQIHYAESGQQNDAVHQRYYPVIYQAAVAANVVLN
jgi:hypothetical protein